MLAQVEEGLGVQLFPCSDFNLTLHQGNTKQDTLSLLQLLCWKEVKLVSPQPTSAVYIAATSLYSGALSRND